MKKSLILTSIILAAALLGCTEDTNAPETADSTNGTNVEATDTTTEIQDEQSQADADKDAVTEHFWENTNFYVDASDKSYALYLKNSGELIREYNEFGLLSAIETDGSVTETAFGIGLSGNGTTRVYEITDDYGERAVLHPEQSAHIVGDFIVSDWQLYTANLKDLGSTHALYPVNEAPKYNEEAVFGLEGSEYCVKFYLAEVQDGMPIIPKTDDSNVYIGFYDDGYGEYIGIFMDNGKLMYRSFTEYSDFVTPLGVYIREETSVATIAGNVAGYDLYLASNASFLADKNGNIVLFEFGEIYESDGFVIKAPNDLQRPYSLLNTDLEVIVKNCRHSRTLENGKLIACAVKDYSPSYANSIVIVETDGTVTTLTECNALYALSDYGALYVRNGKLWFIEPSGKETELAVWTNTLTYEGQARIGEFENAHEYYYFRDNSDINDEGVSLVYEWTFTPESSEFQMSTYYAASLHESVYDMNHPY